MTNSKVEEMLTQLIKIVGNTQTDIQEMKSDIRDMKADIVEMKADIVEMKADIEEIKADNFRRDLEFQDFKTISEERHTAIMNQLKNLENDQDFIWEKTVRNEREIGNMKRQLNSFEITP